MDRFLRIMSDDDYFDNEETIVFNPRIRVRVPKSSPLSSEPLSSKIPKPVNKPLQKKQLDPSVGLCFTPISSDPRRDAFKDYQEQISRANAGHTMMWDAPLPSRNQPKVGDYFIFWFYKERIIVHRITDIQPPTSRPETWTASGHSNRNVVFLGAECCRMDWDDFLQVNGYKRCMGTVCATQGRVATILPAIESALQ